MPDKEDERRIGNGYRDETKKLGSLKLPLMSPTGTQIIVNISENLTLEQK